VEWIDLATGTGLWTASLDPEPASDGNLAVLVTPEGVVVVRESIALLAGADGGSVWSIPGVGPVRPVSSWLFRENSLLIPGLDGSVSRITWDGKLAWKVRPAGAAVHVIDHDGSVLVARNDPATRSSGPRAVSFDTGETIWKRESDAAMTSGPVAIGPKIYFVDCDRSSARNHLRVWAAAGGEPVSEVELQSTGDGRSPDLLVPYEDHLVVIQDNAVSAYGLQDLRRLWSIPIEWDYPYARLKETAVSDLEALVDFEDLLKKKGYLAGRDATSVEAFDLAFSDQKANLWQDAAARNTAATYARTASTPRVRRAASSTGRSPSRSG